MSLRIEFVTMAQHPEANIRQLCRHHGISPTAAYKWLKRYAEGGWEALQEKSRRPQSSPQRTDAAIEAKVVALRQEHRPGVGESYIGGLKIWVIPICRHRAR